MPRALRVCSSPGCASLVPAGKRYCPEHTRRSPDDRPSAAQRGYDAEWRRIRKAHLKQHPLCAMCMAQGIEREGNHVDHIIPLAHGGTHDPSNLQTLCHAHHSQKTARYDGGFGRVGKGGRNR